MSADDSEDYDDAENAPRTVSSVVRKDNGDIHIAITINNNNSNDGGATITGDEIGDEFGVGAGPGPAFDPAGRARPSAPTLDAAVPGPFVRGTPDDAFAAAPVYTKGRAPFGGDPGSGGGPRARISLGGLVAHGRAALFTPAVIHPAQGIYQGLCVVEIGAGNAPTEVTLVPDAAVDAPWAHATHALRTGFPGGHFRLAVVATAKAGKGKAAPPGITVTLTPVDGPAGGFLNVIPAGPDPAAADGPATTLADYAARGACVPVSPAGGTITVPRPAGAAGFFFVVTSTRPDALSPPLLEVRSNVGYLGE
ncbi:hypothetical protein L6V77_28310 [Myxococcota bacterium]|nr:hypothetical protein [Myxococcota bacterium]